MKRKRGPSSQTLRVLSALSNEPVQWRYGYELGVEVELRSGSLYPILVRLSDRELLESRWEDDPPAGRPPRHLYRLTTQGLEYAALFPDVAATRTRSRRRAELRGAS